MNKKIFVLLILLLFVSFDTQAFASLTFTSDAITGTTASSIDLGAGNTLSLNTTNNAPITTGTGLVTLGGGLNIGGKIGIGTTTPISTLDLVASIPLGVEGSPTSAFSVTAAGTGSDPLGNFNAASLEFSAGYNGPGTTTGLYVRNLSDLASGGMSTGVMGEASVNGANHGMGIGGYFSALGAQEGNYGIIGSSYSGTGIGVLGESGTSSSTLRIGGYFSINTPSTKAWPVAGNAALIASNGNTTGSIFLAQDNNSTVFTIADGGAVTSTSNITATQYKLSALNTAPSSATDTGTAGEVRFTTTGIYICVATNSWIKAAAAAW